LHYNYTSGTEETCGNNGRRSSVTVGYQHHPKKGRDLGGSKRIWKDQKHQDQEEQALMYSDFNG
jgi:hypothetical protein